MDAWKSWFEWWLQVERRWKALDGESFSGISQFITFGGGYSFNYFILIMKGAQTTDEKTDERRFQQIP